MAAINLFGTSSGRSATDELVKFRAGKMSLAGKTVTSDTRKGYVYLKQSDGVLHFCWRERSSSQPELDLILFPHDSEFKKVEACKDGRVYVLKFKATSKKEFFWMQEPNEDNDQGFVDKINRYVNDPSSIPSGDDDGGMRGELTGGNIQELMSSLRGMPTNVTQQDIMRMLSTINEGGMGASPRSAGGEVAGSRTRRTREAEDVMSHGGRGGNESGGSGAGPRTGAPPTTATPTPSVPPPPEAASGENQLSSLQSLLGEIAVPSGAASGTTPGAGGLPLNIPPPHPPVNLADVFKSDILTRILAREEYRAQLLEHIPEGKEKEIIESFGAEGSLLENARSPQFQQALRIFSAAFSSGQLGALLGQFHLPPDAITAARNGDMTAFGKALEKVEGGKEEKMEEEDGGSGSEAKKKKKEEDKSEKKEDPGEEDAMDLD